MVKRPQVGVILGLIIALAIPVSTFVVAILWGVGVLDLGSGGAHRPNHPLVETLFSLAAWELSWVPWESCLAVGWPVYAACEPGGA